MNTEGNPGQTCATSLEAIAGDLVIAFFVARRISCIAPLACSSAPLQRKRIVHCETDQPFQQFMRRKIDSDTVTGQVLCDRRGVFRQFWPNPRCHVWFRLSLHFLNKYLW